MCCASCAAGAPPSPALRAVLEQVARLYAARCVESDIGWFMGQEVLSAQVGCGADLLVYSRVLLGRTHFLRTAVPTCMGPPSD